MFYKLNSVENADLIPNTVKCAKFLLNKNTLTIVTTPFCSINSRKDSYSVLNRARQSINEFQKGNLVLLLIIKLFFKRKI